MKLYFEVKERKKKPSRMIHTTYQNMLKVVESEIREC